MTNSPLIQIHETRQGRMMLLNTDTVLSKKIREEGDYAPEEKELLEKLLSEGDTVVDAGANIGSHTLFFARAVGRDGRVYSFEPQRFIFQILCGNVALNALRNVWCIPAALGTQDGRIDVPVPNYERPNNFGGYSLDFPTFKESGQIKQLDSLKLEACRLIKIDVEGMELDVLGGAERTIKSYRPALYLENNRKDKSTDLLEHIIIRLDYRVFKHGQNILCLPAEVQGKQGVTEGLPELFL